MSDVVVTVPKRLWEDWIEEGDLPGESWSGEEWHFYLSGAVPRIQPGERVYVVAYGRLRGYAPLVRFEPARGGCCDCLVYDLRPQAIRVLGLGEQPHRVWGILREGRTRK